MSGIHETVSFLRQFVSRPSQIGAIAPSSRRLARALTAPLAAATAPRTVLELGAGTGPVTRRIAGLLQPADTLDVCEANPTLARHLADHVLSDPRLAEARAAGRIRLFDQPIQDVDGLLQYDFIVSGLPLTAFSLADVEAILALVERHLTPGGVFSYFEYIAIRKILWPVRGAAFRELSACLTRRIRRHQFARQAVWANMPPAAARHWRFTPVPDHSAGIEQ